MADWAYIPSYDYMGDVDSPPTLITRYEDGTEHRRAKHTSFPRTFTEVHIVDGTDMDAMLDFFRTKGLLTSFTKVSYDPSEAPATEATVRFTSSFKFVRGGNDEFSTTIVFIEVL